MTSLISAVVVCSSGARRLRRSTCSVDALDAERELEAQRAADLEHDAALRLRREPGQRRHDVPLADAQRRQEEAAFGVGDALDDGAAGRMRRRDGGAGQDAAGAVPDDAADLTGVDLRGGTGSHREDDERGKNNPIGQHDLKRLPPWYQRLL